MCLITQHRGEGRGVPHSPFALAGTYTEFLQTPHNLTQRQLVIADPVENHSYDTGLHLIYNVMRLYKVGVRRLTLFAYECVAIQRITQDYMAAPGLAKFTDAETLRYLHSLILRKKAMYAVEDFLHRVLRSLPCLEVNLFACLSSLVQYELLVCVSTGEA